MAYRYDEDLKFLDRARHKDLQGLVYVLTHDPEDGETRWTEELSSKLKGCRDHHDMWQEIAGELQCFGGDTFANMMRGGKGVPYRELLCDVCDKCDIKYNKHATNIEEIEDALIARQGKQMWEAWDEETRRAYALNMKLYSGALKRFSVAQIANTMGAGAIATVINGGGLGGFIVAQSISGITAASAMGVSMGAVGGVGSAALSFLAPRAVSFLIPATAVFSILSLAFAFSGPAYRVTLPACLQVASLRKTVALTPREILRMETIRERAEQLQALLNQYQKETAKLLNLYLFSLKVADELNANVAVDDMKDLIFGYLSGLDSQIEKYNQERGRIGLSDAYRLVRNDNVDNARIANLVYTVTALAGLDEEAAKPVLSKLGI